MWRWLCSRTRETFQVFGNRAVHLKAEAREIIQWILLNPELPRPRSKGYRRVNLKIFPYYIAYFIWSETVWIVATAHSKKRPEYWIRRRSHIPDL